MRALAIERHGGPEQVSLHELPDPQPGPGEARVAVRASALNHLDLWGMRGLPGVTVPFPFVLGADGAGVVDAVGPGVPDDLVGQAVVINPVLSCGRCEMCVRGERPLCRRFAMLGEHRNGTHAEYAVIPAVGAVPKPDELSFEDAAAAAVTFATAWRMLMVKARVLPGETVLVHGIGGGLALAALRLGLLAGARVVVTSSDDAKLERARELGAAVGVNYRDQDLVKTLRGAVGAVDVVIDSVGTPTWDASIRILRNGGRLVNCGATAGDEGTVPIRHLFWRQLSVLGSTMASDGEFRDLLTALARHPEVRPVIDRRVPLTGGAAAFATLEAGEQFGKIVLTR